MIDACYDRGAPFFFTEVPQFWSSRTFPKNKFLEEKKNRYLLHRDRMKSPMAYVHDERTLRENKQLFFFPDGFGLRSPLSVQKTFQTKCATSDYRSMRLFRVIDISASRQSESGDDSEVQSHSGECVSNSVVKKGGTAPAPPPPAPP